MSCRGAFHALRSGMTISIYRAEAMFMFLRGVQINSPGPLRDGPQTLDLLAACASTGASRPQGSLPVWGGLH